MRVVELQGIKNVRDLGGIPTRTGRVVTPGILYRGSALAGLTPVDQDVLFDHLGITCVIDLRTGWEREAKPDPVVPGVENLHIPFYDLEKVGIEYTEPAAGTKVVGRDVACEPDHFYRSLANPLTVNQMRQAVDEAFARAMAGRPVYLHCSGGKDRVGILALLVLTVLDATPEAILDDYLLTNVARDKNYEQMLQRFLNFTGDEARARELVESHRALPENLGAFREAVCENYGSMESFMRVQLNMSSERQALLQAACTCEASAAEALLGNQVHEVVR